MSNMSNLNDNQSKKSFENNESNQYSTLNHPSSFNKFNGKSDVKINSKQSCDYFQKESTNCNYYSNVLVNNIPTNCMPPSNSYSNQFASSNGYKNQYMFPECGNFPPVLHSSEENKNKFYNPNILNNYNVIDQNQLCLIPPQPVFLNYSMVGRNGDNYQAIPNINGNILPNSMPNCHYNSNGEIISNNVSNFPFPNVPNYQVLLTPATCNTSVNYKQNCDNEKSNFNSENYLPSNNNGNAHKKEYQERTSKNNMRNYGSRNKYEDEEFKYKNSKDYYNKKSYSSRHSRNRSRSRSRSYSRNRKRRISSRSRSRSRSRKKRNRYRSKSSSRSRSYSRSHHGSRSRSRSLSKDSYSNYKNKFYHSRSRSRNRRHYKSRSPPSYRTYKRRETYFDKRESNNSFVLKSDSYRQKLIKRWRMNYCENQDEMQKRLQEISQMNPEEILEEENKVWIRSAPAYCYYERDPK